MEKGGSGRGARVAIIGAGVSGLAACKYCCENELDATVLEGKSGVGGVWRVSYASTRLQTPRGAYKFTDFPWPESAPTFPSHHQVVDYLESYARHFGFWDRIRFNCQVVEVKRSVRTPADGQQSHDDVLGASRFASCGWVGEEGDDVKEELVQESVVAAGTKAWDDGDVVWEVCVRKKKQQLPAGSEEEGGQIDDYVDEWHLFDYLIICCGRYGDVAKLPSFPSSQGPDVFNGQVLHSLDYSALGSENTQALLRGKKVVVVGFGKTSLDVAVEVADLNQGVDNAMPCTLLFRHAQWMFPRHRKAFGLFPFAYLWSTRLSEYWFPKPGQGVLQNLLQLVTYPVRWLVWTLLEHYLRAAIPVAKYGVVPEQSLFKGLSACVLPQVPQSLLGHLEAGRIVPKKTPFWHFYPKGVRLADGTDIEANVVIFCTGYDGNSKLKAMFPEDETAELFKTGLETERVLSLYRGIIHPQLPKVGFVGYLEGLSCMHSAEMAAMWLTQLLRKRITLPDTATMEADRRGWVRHWKSRTPFLDQSCACVATMHIWHVDKLCKDLAVNWLRKKTLWQELFSVYGSSDYKALLSSSSSSSSRE